MISLTLLLLAAAPGPAQEATAVAPQEETSATKRYESLKAEYDEAYQAWMTNVRQMFADAEAKGEEITEYPPQPSEEFFPRFVAAAKDYAGTDDAAPFLVWVVQNGLFQRHPEAMKAMDALMAHHVASKHLEPLAPMLQSLAYIYEDEAATMVAKLEQGSSSAVVRGWATFTRLTPVFKNNAPDSKAFLAAKKEMLAILARVDDPYLKQSFDGEVTVLEKFGMGMLAPDITAPDLDGVEFSLSDYKGKVLFVDFWGDW